MAGHQQKGTRKSEATKTCKETQLTIRNRKPPILLLHLKFALTLCLSILLVFVHLFLLFARLRPGLFMLLRGMRL